jgi:hypothetical protein
LLTPFGWRQIGPTQAPRNNIFATVLQHAQKRFVSFDNCAFQIRNADPQNIGIDQAADLPFLGTGDAGVKPHRLHQQNDQHYG